MQPDGIEFFAGDLPEPEQKLVWAAQGVPVADLFNQKLKGASVEDKSRAGTSSPRTTAPSRPSSSASSPSA